MSASSVLVIARKEFTDVLRDRRTLFFMLLLPIVVIPVLMIVISDFMKAQLKERESRQLAFAIQPENRQLLRALANRWMHDNEAAFRAVAVRIGVEAFGGRSLVAGLNGPVAGSELGAVDDLPPDEHGWLIGLSARAPIANRGGMAATWQRVIRADHAALYSERLAADASWRALSTTVDASLTWDAAERQVNDARLRLARPLPRGMTASVEAVRHRPFFEAWTIWGAFSPVAFDEARAAVAWRAADARWGADVRGGWRSYDESGEGLEATPLKTDGWRAGAGLEWQPRPRWLLYGDYDIDVGFGASRSDAAAGVRWMPDESRWLGLVASSLQHIYEFRVGTGRITGLRVEGATRLGPEARLVLDGALYDHHLTNGAAGPDWSQRRFSLRLEWTIGRDPGAGGAR